MINIKIDFPKSIEKELKEMSGKLTKKVNKAIQDSAHVVRNEAVLGIQRGSKTGKTYKRRTVEHKASAPGEYPASWSGRLADSQRIIKGFLQAEVGSDLIYAKPLEDGTDKMQPRPYLEPSYEKNKETISKLIDKAIEEALNE